jgi:hypothetical protein
MLIEHLRWPARCYQEIMPWKNTPTDAQLPFCSEEWFDPLEAVV